MTHMFPPPRVPAEIDPSLPAALQAQLQHLAQHALDHGHARAAQVIRQTSALLAEPYVWDKATATAGELAGND